MIKNRIIFFLACSYFVSFSFAQKEIDSLQALLKVAKPDTGKVELLNSLGRAYLNANSQKSIFYSNAAKDLALKLKDQLAVSRALNNIGMAYENMGSYDEAMKNYFESLKIKESLNYEEGLVSTYNNIGLVYDVQGNINEALKYYQKSYDIAIKVKDEDGISNALLNIGVVQMEKNNNESAYNYFNRSLALSLKTGNKKSMLNALNDIGLYYQTVGKSDSALLNYEKGITIGRETGDSLNIASFYNNTAVVLFERKDYKHAVIAMDRAVAAARSIDAKPNLQNYYENLAEFYDTLRDYKQAYFYHKLYSDLKDTLQSSDKQKRISELAFAYETEKRGKELALIEKEKEIRREAEKNKQKLLIVYLVSGVVLALLILLLLYGRFRLVKKQKVTIEEKNALVESKNKEITDSINYAKRIQHALLAGEKILQQNLPEYFVLYKPKDIVSGDFYWAGTQGERFYLCAGDCTGHGVPGAFMSLLNMSYLNEALKEKHIESPDKILNDVRQQIILSLNPEGREEESKDGMDAVLCMFDLKGMWLRFACANNPLWLIRNNELKIFEGDKMPVGMHHGELKPFTLQTLGLRKGDIVYMLTDGYADQFGGDKGKKFKYKKLQELLLGISVKPMKEQKQILDETLERWRGPLEQVDDILLIGIKF